MLNHINILIRVPVWKPSKHWACLNDLMVVKKTFTTFKVEWHDLRHCNKTIILCIEFSFTFLSNCKVSWFKFHLFAYHKYIYEHKLNRGKIFCCKSMVLNETKSYIANFIDDLLQMACNNIVIKYHAAVTNCTKMSQLINFLIYFIFSLNQLTSLRIFPW